MSKKKVRGLLDVVGLADGEWEHEEISADYVPGLGPGATDEARRWAYLGYTIELEMVRSKIAEETQNKRGRRPVPETTKKPNRMAFHLWFELRSMPIEFRQNQSNRALIRWMQDRVANHKAMQRLWQPCTSLESSLSQGKSYWEIGPDWTSAKCDEFLAKLMGEAFPSGC